MIFADKLIELRKKYGWTQEELAEKMAVSRQSVAKWESAQSIPELSKIIKLSDLFSVTIDYLLKDEIEEAEYAGSDAGDEKACRRVSMEEANQFIASRKKAAMPIAAAVMLCILSPICLLLLGVLSGHPEYGISENAAAGMGICVLIAIIAVAVMLFIMTGNKNSQYEYMEKELIETEYGVDGMVKEKRSKFKHTYDTYNLIGTIICIIAVIPLFIGIIFDERNDLLMVSMVCVLIALVSIGVMFFVRAGVVWASFEKLLQDGEYTKEKKKEQNSVIGAISTAYWLIATAVYLACSFATRRWNITWIIWPAAGILYPVLISILRALVNKKKE